MHAPMAAMRPHACRSVVGQSTVSPQHCRCSRPGPRGRSSGLDIARTVCRPSTSWKPRGSPGWVFCESHPEASWCLSSPNHHARRKPYLRVTLHSSVPAPAAAVAPAAHLDLLAPLLDSRPPSHRASHALRNNCGRHVRPPDSMALITKVRHGVTHRPEFRPDVRRQMRKYADAQPHCLGASSC